MKQVNFYSIGTIVYCIHINVITKYKVEDVIIDIKQDIPVKYKLSNFDTSQNTILNQNQVFQSLTDLKDIILKQFDELTPKEVGECKEETKEETVS